MSRFAMETWTVRRADVSPKKPIRDDEPHEWLRMDEHGSARSHWRPRKTAAEAIKRCREWTGLFGIPSMQVRDLTTGEVVWRDSRQDPAAGPCIPARLDDQRV